MTVEELKTLIGNMPNETKIGIKPDAYNLNLNVILEKVWCPNAKAHIIIFRPPSYVRPVS